MFSSMVSRNSHMANNEESVDTRQPLKREELCTLSTDQEAPIFSFTSSKNKRLNNIDRLFNNRQLYTMGIEASPGDILDPTSQISETMTNSGRREKRGRKGKPRKAVMMSSLSSADEILLSEEEHTEVNEVHDMALSDDVGFTCSDCGYCTLQERFYIKHKEMHDTKNSYTCEVCGYKSAYYGNWYNHQKKQHPQHFACAFCEFKTAFQNKMDVHMKIHTGFQDIRCRDFKDNETEQNLNKLPMCMEEKNCFSTRIENSQEKYACDICNYTTSCGNYLSSHYMLHDDNNSHTCETCGYKTALRANLLVHQRQHTGEKPFACDRCDFKTAFKHSLKLHQSKHEREAEFESVPKAEDIEENEEDIEERSPVEALSKEYICHVCGYSTTQERFLAKHEQLHKIQKSHTCEMCGYKTAYYGNLYSHKKKRHPDYYSCELCSYSTAFQQKITVHSVMHSRTATASTNSVGNMDVMSFEKSRDKGCETPVTILDSENDVVVALSMENQDESTKFFCDMCDYITSDESALAAHCKQHENTASHVFESCGYRRAWRASLPIHRRRDAGEERFTVDVHTEKKNSRSTAAKLNVELLAQSNGKLNGGDEQKYACHLCKYSTKSESVFRKHLIMHEKGSSFTCDICGYKTAFNGNLRKHMRKHTGEKPFTCEKCGFKTSFESSLNIHKRKHCLGENELASEEDLEIDTEVSKSNLEPAIDDDVAETSSIEMNKEDFPSNFLQSAEFVLDSEETSKTRYPPSRRYSCGLCAYACNSHSVLEKHQKLHNVTKKIFSCDICGYKTAFNGNLRKHMRKHTGEKPFTCEKCGFKTSFESSLNIHKRKHCIGNDNDENKNLAEAAIDDVYTRLSINAVKKSQAYRYSCLLCSYSTNSESEFGKHNDYHIEQDTYLYQERDLKVAQARDLHKQLQRHTDEESFAFGSRTVYKTVIEGDANAHKRKRGQSGLDRDYVKEDCTNLESEGNGYENSSTEMLSTSMNHPDNSLFICELCDYSTASQNAFRQHKEMHSKGGLHNCLECEYKTSIRGNLKKHMRKHTGEKPFKCNECAFKTSFESSLNMHKRRHEVRDNNLVGLPTENKENFQDHYSSPSFVVPSGRYNGVSHNNTEEKPSCQRNLKKFSCDLCPYGATTEAFLNTHKKLHASAKSHNCDICGYRTAFRGNLHKHIRKHKENSLKEHDISSNGQSMAKAKEESFEANGSIEHCEKKLKTEREMANDKDKEVSLTGTSVQRYSSINGWRTKHACQLCTYSTFTELILKKHIELHSDERSHKCDVCGYLTKFAGNLRVHKKKHGLTESFSCDLCDFVTEFESTLIVHQKQQHKSLATDLPTFINQFRNGIEANGSAENTDEKSDSIDQELSSNSLNTPEKCQTAESLSKTHSTSKPFECRLCNKKFSSLANCKEHAKLHNGMKLFTSQKVVNPGAHNFSVISSENVCNGEKFLESVEPLSEVTTCPTSTFDGIGDIKESKVKNGLNNSLEIKPVQTSHELANQETSKLYNCEYCDYNSSFKHNLDRHTHTHTGQKPHQCTNCDYRSSSYGNLKRHFDSFHQSGKDHLQKLKVKLPAKKNKRLKRALGTVKETWHEKCESLDKICHNLSSRRNASTNDTDSDNDVSMGDDELENNAELAVGENISGVENTGIVSVNGCF